MALNDFIRFDENGISGVAQVVSEDTVRCIAVETTAGQDIDGKIISFPQKYEIITGIAYFSYRALADKLEKQWNKIPYYKSPLKERDVERLNETCLRESRKVIYGPVEDIREFAKMVYDLNHQFDKMFINYETLSIIGDFSKDFITSYCSFGDGSDYKSFTGSSRVVARSWCQKHKDVKRKSVKGFTKGTYNT